MVEEAPHNGIGGSAHWLVLTMIEEAPHNG